MGAEVYPLLPMKAAVLLESVARFRPLINGNKCTAWTLMVLMLWINGYRHDFTADEGFDLVVGMASGEMSIERSAHLIFAHLVTRYTGFKRSRIGVFPLGTHLLADSPALPQ